MPGRAPHEPVLVGALMREVIRERARSSGTTMPAWEAEHGIDRSIQGEPALSILSAPLISGGEVRGRISLQNLDRINAFTDADVRLLSTLAGA